MLNERALKASSQKFYKTTKYPDIFDFIKDPEPYIQILLESVLDKDINIPTSSIPLSERGLLPPLEEETIQCLC